MPSPFTDFDELLRSAVESASAPFSRLNRDLHSCVQRAALSVVRHSEGQATLQLRVIADDPRGRWYSLDLLSVGNRRRALANFRVNVDGAAIEQWEATTFRSKTPWLRRSAVMPDAASIDRQIAAILTLPRLHVAEEIFALRREAENARAMA